MPKHNYKGSYTVTSKSKRTLQLLAELSDTYDGKFLSNHDRQSELHSKCVQTSNNTVFSLHFWYLMKDYLFFYFIWVFFQDVVGGERGQKMQEKSSNHSMVLIEYAVISKLLQTYLIYGSILLYDRSQIFDQLFLLYILKVFVSTVADVVVVAQTPFRMS